MKYSARLVTALAALALLVAIVVSLTGSATAPDTGTVTAASIQSTDIPALLPEGGGTALVLTNFDTATEVAPITVTTIDLPTLLEGGGPDTLVGQFDTTTDDPDAIHAASAAPIAITTITMLAVLAVMRGGVAFFYSSVSTLTRWFVGLTSITKRATALFAYVSGAGRTTRTTMPMDITQHRHVAAVDTYYTDDGDTKNGFRRMLRWTTAEIADITARLQRTRPLPHLA